jgi:hypothetical protein
MPKSKAKSKAEIDAAFDVRWKEQQDQLKKRRGYYGTVIVVNELQDKIVSNLIDCMRQTKNSLRDALPCVQELHNRILGSISKQKEQKKAARVARKASPRPAKTPRGARKAA